MMYTDGKHKSKKDKTINKLRKDIKALEARISSLEALLSKNVVYIQYPATSMPQLLISPYYTCNTNNDNDVC